VSDDKPSSVEAFKMNVINLEAHRDQNRDNDAQNRDDVLEAMWQGIANSKWSRDPNDPDAPATLAHFIAHVADEAPLSVLKILTQYIEPPTKD
jgi:hypothetical protein